MNKLFVFAGAIAATAALQPPALPFTAVQTALFSVPLSWVSFAS